MSNNSSKLFEGIDFPEVKHVIGMEDFDHKTTEMIVNGAVEIARRMRGGYKWWDDPIQRQKKAAIISAEGSTRTIGSTDRAGEILGWNRRIIALGDTSLAKKRETWEHSAMTWRIQGATTLALRTTTEGVQKWIAECFDSNNFDTSMINMGDGWARHPTQAFLDLVTIMLLKERLGNITIGFIGDALRGRVIHSLLEGLRHWTGISVICVSPKNLRLPKHYQRMLSSYEETEDPSALANCDVVYVLRTQQERPLEGAPPDQNGYQNFRLTQEVMQMLRKDAIVMHAQPVDGVEQELVHEIEHDPRVVMWQQNENGIYTRMYLMEMCWDNRHLADYHLPKNNIEVQETFSEPLETSLKRQKDKHCDRFVPIENIGVAIDHITAGMGRSLGDMLENQSKISGTMDVFEKVASPNKPESVKDVIIIRGQLLDDDALGMIISLDPNATINPISEGKHRKLFVVPSSRIIRGIGKCQNSDACITRMPGQPGIKPRFVLTNNNGDPTMAMCEYCRREYPLKQVLEINS